MYLIILALLIALFFSFILNAKGPWGNFWVFYLVIFFGILLADIWLRPMGPYWLDVYWIPPLIVGVLVALLLAAATPEKSIREKRRKKDSDEEDDKSPLAGISIFFWIVLFLFIVFAIAGIYLVD